MAVALAKSVARQGGSIPVPQEAPFCIRAACERIGLARADLVGMIYKKLTELKENVPPSMLRVLDAMIFHLNDEDNRIWASVPTLAEVAGGRGEEGAMSHSTVELNTGILRDGEYIRIVRGEELYAGSGAHRAKERGVRARSSRAVTHYDLSGLFSLLPPLIRRILAGTCRMLARIAAPAQSQSLQSQLDTAGAEYREYRGFFFCSIYRDNR